MAQNNANVISFSRPESNSNPIEKREPKYNRPHCIIPVEDLSWAISQGRTIQNLWNECWKSDPFGSRWVKLTTSLSDRAFRLARKVLYTTGLFEFKPEKDVSDTRKTTNWLVVNLHGARRIAEFWNKEPADESVPPNSNVVKIGDKSVPHIGESVAICDVDSPIGDKSVPPICSKTLANTGVPDSLSNSSLSFQEPLKGVTEKDIEILAPPEPLGGVPAASGGEWIPEQIRKFRAMGTKAGDFMARSLERLQKRFQANEIKTDMDFYKEEFKLKYDWDIPAVNLQQFCDLSQDLRNLFLNAFTSLYQKRDTRLFLYSESFTKAINTIMQDSQVNRRAREKNDEYFQYPVKRREELLNTQPAT